MVTIKLEKTDSLGNPTGVFVEFEASVVYGKDYKKQRFGQSTIRALDGVQHTFDRGVTVVYGELALRGMDVVTKGMLEAFIISELNFNEGYFAITTTPCGTTSRDIDLGNGFGVPIGVCKLGEDFTNTEEVFKFKAPGLYDVRLPYTYTL